MQHYFQPQEGIMPEDQQQYYANQQQKLQTFLSNYQKSQKHQKHYKHSVELSAKTIGASKQFKASVQLQAQCNDKMQVCQLRLGAERSKMNEERGMWTMKGLVEMVMPGGAEEENSNNYSSDQFLSFANLHWGADTRKQQVNMRIVGEQAPERTSGWYMFQNQQEGENQEREQNEENQNSDQNSSPFITKLQRRTAFINLYNCRMEYTNLTPATRNVFERAVELVNSKYFWNSKTELKGESSLNPENGKVYCTLSIDSLTQNHANITLMTPEQIVHLQQIEMPFKLRPFSLRRRNVQSIQSFDQFYSQQEIKNRAECSIDGRIVRTFDGKRYKAPLSTSCYSVLAKDCGRMIHIPDFKLKILTPGQSIECQHERADSRKIVCKINGRYLNENNENNLVEYSNAKMSDVTLHLDEVSVRFNGYKAWIKLSGAYRNTQCGLCGHYDDATNDENEMIMANNEFTSNLAQFHRSYSLSNSHDSNDLMCNEQQLDRFYEENKNKFGYSEALEIIEEEKGNEMKEGNKNKKYNEWEDEMFDGTLGDQSENDEAYFSDNYEGNEQYIMRSEMNGNRMEKIIGW
ncbi:unnamed protein product [Meloidogyne enterolobii]|uniref:Uncharacterized protein n=1 Tax=Meloidogyne enterolobii TaxID=390850 RepID=A0ACB1AY64_MELEN